MDQRGAPRVRQSGPKWNQKQYQGTRVDQSGKINVFFCFYLQTSSHYLPRRGQTKVPGRGGRRCGGRNGDDDDDEITSYIYKADKHIATYVVKYTYICVYTYVRTYIHTYTRTGRQTDRQADRQTDRQT